MLKNKTLIILLIAMTFISSCNNDVDIPKEKVVITNQESVEGVKNIDGLIVKVNYKDVPGYSYQKGNIQGSVGPERKIYVSIENTNSYSIDFGGAYLVKGEKVGPNTSGKLTLIDTKVFNTFSDSLLANEIHYYAILLGSNEIISVINGQYSSTYFSDFEGKTYSPCEAIAIYIYNTIKK